MSKLNQVTLFGRLTRDPDYRQFSSGAVAKLGFAVTNRKKNSQTGQWEDDPMFINVEVFNRGENGKTADMVADSCKKGHRLLITGSLHLDSWEDKNGGGKRSQHKIIADEVVFIEPRPEGQGQGGQNAPQGNQQQNRGSYNGGGQGNQQQNRNNYQNNNRQQNNQPNDQQSSDGDGGIPF